MTDRRQHEAIIHQEIAAQKRGGAEELCERARRDKEWGNFPWSSPVTVEAFDGFIAPTALRAPHNLLPAPKQRPASDIRDWAALALIGMQSGTLPARGTVITPWGLTDHEEGIGGGVPPKTVRWL